MAPRIGFHARLDGKPLLKRRPHQHGVRVVGRPIRRPILAAEDRSGHVERRFRVAAHPAILGWQSEPDDECDMPKRATPETPTHPERAADPEQYRRFVEKARELECDDDEEAFERVFSRMVPPRRPGHPLPQRPVPAKVEAKLPKRRRFYT
jgi:hypothetical protein